MAVTVAALAAVACFCMGASASTPVDIRDVPYHVRVRSLLPNGTHILCGGSILSDRIVLTAAHCTDGKDVSSLTVRAGSADRARGGQELPVARVFQDPRWTEATKDFDVSVLQLEGRITFGDTARPIALVAPLTEQPTGSRGLVAGWGRSSGDGIPSETLGSALLQYIDRLPCRRAFVKGRITPRMVCYGGVVGPACDVSTNLMAFFNTKKKTPRDLRRREQRVSDGSFVNFVGKPF
ncbi:trypsin-1-like [Thrips palmi]|uniref:Trypsin-1-like n=1 Tax=Thrips palmi TaxID=161013 RepID=A0A6P9AEQ3_THRPL|nr:trypsin-1-like [Thrips palmi]